MGTTCPMLGGHFVWAGDGPDLSEIALYSDEARRSNPRAKSGKIRILPAKRELEPITPHLGREQLVGASKLPPGLSPLIIPPNDDQRPTKEKNRIRS